VNASVTLGRIAGIRIGVHWSWLVVFVLIVWSLATSVFPELVDDLSDAEYLALALVAAFLFFASLLAHEYGHALTARREGMEIEGINLWLFGGVAQFRGMFPSAGAELRIAAAGPAVSLVLGVFFLAVAGLIDFAAAVDAIAAYLGSINLLLVVFNLLPALPLDGGRILRALLWRARADFAWATRISAGIGRAFGYGLIGLGIVSFIAGGGVSGVWLAFMGWFLLGAATAEARYLAVRDAFGGLRVRDLMVRDPATVSPRMTLGRFMDDVVWSRRYTTYPVVEDGRAVGLLPFRCVAEVPRREWDERTVADCMLPPERVPAVDDLAGAMARALAADGPTLLELSMSLEPPWEF